MDGSLASSSCDAQEGSLVKWAQEICAGSHKMFRGTGCEYYDDPRCACVLLRERRINEICQIGRCTFAMADFVQDQFHKGLSERLRGVDEREDVNVKQMIGRLTRVIWEDSLTITGWMAFLQKVARRVVMNVLIKQKFLPARNKCGTCQELTPSNPHICQISGEKKRKGDAACELYQFSPRFFVSESDVNPDDSDSNTEVQYLPTATERSQEAQRSVDARMDVESLRLALKKRVEAAKEGTHRKAVFIRQYDLFVNLHKLLRDVDSETEALKILSGQMGLSKRMVRRDMAEIREFLSSLFQ
jgi:hypothetical protein